MNRCIEADFIEKVVNSIEGLTRNSMFLITDMETRKTWLSEKACQLLDVTENCQENLFEKMSELIHPYDKLEFDDAMADRLEGKNIGGELLVRLIKNGESIMVSVLTDMVKAGSRDKYLVVVLRNDNVEPEIDAHTDLYGRARFKSDIAKIIEKKAKVAVIELEIDHLDDISILYGMDCSDRIQKEVALRFIYMMDENKAVYRMNGGRFAFILKDYGRAESEGFVEHLRDIFENEIVFEGYQFVPKAYYSGLLLDNYVGEIDSVQSKAGYALDMAKSKHSKEVVFFNDLVRLESNADLELMKILYQSILRDCEGFYVEYQPIVRAQDGVIMGAEALVRWKKEPYGNVPPGVFIEWLEDNPIIFDLGNYVLREALLAGKKFISINKDFFINVNVSAKQLERNNFRHVVLEILAETGFPASHLCLELTERCRNLPISFLSEEMQFLRDTGIKLAMDDYGTGAASSSIVLNVPMNEIKIDMSFIKGIKTNPKQQALVKNMIKFANEAGLTTCLEGVEDKELEEYLRGYGATWFQGYCYSRPVSSETLEHMLRVAAEKE